MLVQQEMPPGGQSSSLYKPIAQVSVTTPTASGAACVCILARQKSNRYQRDKIDLLEDAMQCMPAFGLSSHSSSAKTVQRVSHSRKVLILYTHVNICMRLLMHVVSAAPKPYCMRPPINVWYIYWRWELARTSLAWTRSIVCWRPAKASEILLIKFGLK